MPGPDIKIQSIVEKEITVTEQGQIVTKLAHVPAGKIDSGVRLCFTLTITNQGDDVATNVVVDNPIPPGTFYVIGSATGEKSVVTCSIDDGVSFRAESQLRQATASMFTDVQWLVEDLRPGTSCKLGFQVIVGGMRSDLGTDKFEPKDKPCNGY